MNVPASDDVEKLSQERKWARGISSYPTIQRGQGDSQPTSKWGGAKATDENQGEWWSSMGRDTVELKIIIAQNLSIRGI